MRLQRVVYAGPFYQEEEPEEVRNGVLEIHYADGRVEEHAVEDLTAVIVHDRQSPLPCAS